MKFATCGNVFLSEYKNTLQVTVCANGKHEKSILTLLRLFQKILITSKTPTNGIFLNLTVVVVKIHLSVAIL